MTGTMTTSESTRDLPPALREAIADAVEAGIRRALVTPSEASHLLTSRQVADRLGVSTRTLQRLVSGGALRPVKVGGQNRYHPDAVDAYVRSRVAGSGRARRKAKGGVR